MYILGINAYHGDVSAVLLKDGKLIVALEEERFRRVKHWAGFPRLAIRKCLEFEGIDASQIDHIAVSRDPKAHLFRKAKFVLTQRTSLRHALERAQNSRKIRDIRGPLAEVLDLHVRELPNIHYVEHHPAHLASAFFVSPFEEAAVCAIDGFGDFVSTSMATGRGNRLNVLGRVYFPHSLGMLYTAITQFLGFHSYGDEFKVMGLAPYGAPEFVDEIRRLVRLKDNGTFELDLNYFQHWSEGVTMEWESGYPSLGKVYTSALEHLLGPERQPKEELTDRHEAIARSLQVVYEECAFHVLNNLWERTKLPRLCLAGGCGMNSVANGKIREQTPFEEVYIQPAAADNGTALGAAYYVWNQVLDQPRTFVMSHGYWGTDYRSADVALLLNGHQDDDWEYRIDHFDAEEAVFEETARLIAEGNVVGWYRGRMEWGARALGNRSILADPRRSDIRDLINLKIKFREKFRPFAPSIAVEALNEYFEDAAEDPFMQQVYPVRRDKKQILPAITHVDGSGRLQTVSADANPDYYRLIKAFEKLTGVPVLLNTSFNENEPIVETPDQALDCFLRTRMDVLVINNSMVRRREKTTSGNRTESGIYNVSGEDV